MADMSFRNLAELDFQVVWSETAGQPVLVCSENSEDLGDQDLASNSTTADISQPASVTVLVAAQNQDDFPECNVYDYDGEPNAWPNGRKTMSLSIGEANEEITFTVAVTTRKPKGPGPYTDGWRVKGEDGPQTTWVLDPYVRLIRAGYPVKTNPPSPLPKRA